MTNLVVFEGLFSNELERTLLPKLKGNFKADIFRWRDYGPKSLLPNFKTVVIGHSLGGARAVKWAEEIGSPIEALITLGPRVFGRPYVRPDNVRLAINFRRVSWWMHGYPVEMAFNRIMNCGHMELPSQPEVIQTIEGLL